MQIQLQKFWLNKGKITVFPILSQNLCDPCHRKKQKEIDSRNRLILGNIKSRACKCNKDCFPNDLYSNWWNTKIILLAKSQCWRSNIKKQLINFGFQSVSELKKEENQKSWQVPSSIWDLQGMEFSLKASPESFCQKILN